MLDHRPTHRCRPFVFTGGHSIYLDEGPQAFRRARMELLRSRADKAAINRSCHRCVTETEMIRTHSPAFVRAQPSGVLVSLRRGSGLTYLCSRDAASAFLAMFGLWRVASMLAANGLPRWTWFRDDMAILAAADCTLAEGYYLTLGCNELSDGGWFSE